MNDHDYCYAEMPSEENKILKLQPWRKVSESAILSFMMTWSDCLKKMHSYQNNPKK